MLNQFQSAQNYSDSAANTDFAVVTLAQPIGNRTGWFGLEYSNLPSEQVDLETAGCVINSVLMTAGVHAA